MVKDKCADRMDTRVEATIKNAESVCPEDNGRRQDIVSVTGKGRTLVQLDRSKNLAGSVWL